MKSDRSIDTGFNHHSVEQMADPYAAYKKLRAECPISHTQSHGGFWVAAKYEDIRKIELDYVTFSNADGTGIPRQPVTPMYPIDIDPPLQTAFRKVLNGWFTVESVAAWRPHCVAVTHALIDNFIERGEADLAAECAGRCRRPSFFRFSAYRQTTKRR